ncbi:CoA-transferase [Microbacterium sp. BWT-B31]|uniref:CoA transferase subunit A n=1 Tax=Microbacterium sp. BWT-B31 TaxID=3232072 RepID=UPI003529859A
MEALVDEIGEGVSISFGGFAHSLTPMAVVREIVRRRIGRLTLIGIAEAWAADMLAGAGLIERMVFSNFMFEGFGLCRNFSRGIESGAFAIEDYSHFALAARMSAAGLGLPFAAVRSVLGSDMLEDETGGSRVTHEVFSSPFGDECVVLFPPAAPDIVVVHGQVGDTNGNVHILGATAVIEEQVRAGKKVLATVEEIVEPVELARRAADMVVPGLLVHKIAAVPYGAHPTGMYRLYDADYEHIREYVAASRDPEQFSDYLAGVTERGQAEYVRNLGVQRLLTLRPDPAYGYHLDRKGDQWTA